jgi:hypothetical protein
MMGRRGVGETGREARERRGDWKMGRKWIGTQLGEQERLEVEQRGTGGLGRA